MMRIGYIALLSLLLFPLWGLAHEGAKGVVKDRMSMMSDLGKQMKLISATVRNKTPFDKGQMQKAGAEIQSHAEKMPALFPKGSHTGKSEAIEAIWIKWDQFKASADALAKDAGAFQKVVATADSGKALIPAFGKIARHCKSCHQDFRRKKKKH